jgi:hypothetical protein
MSDFKEISNGFVSSGVASEATNQQEVVAEKKLESALPMTISKLLGGMGENMDSAIVEFGRKKSDEEESDQDDEEQFNQSLQTVGKLLEGKQRPRNEGQTPRL